MTGRDRGGLGSAVAWLVFPAVPAVLATWCYDAWSAGDDPRRWGSFGAWATKLGPLIGYGFLAGATARLPDDPSRRGWRAVPRRRAVWVAVGPWFAPGLYLSAPFGFLLVMTRVLPPGAWSRPTPAFWDGFWEVLGWASVYGWAAFAVAALRRARRRGRFRRALRDGFLTAVVFVGSLIGVFWAATELWRSYFFDPTPAS